ncbi:hypothetical protein OO17_23370 [Rhodopseudomonas palustris]|uniref:Uncharacterized protein n=1 Tax=Rhodopseudomonas palustris TaxID=1076 RepID=A0A0D7EAH4_RHOPL|nr:hypothetical protein OO17_23370 [Rhodopseudomonas palustris]
MVNDAGLFRDLFFVIGPASAIALSTTLEYLWTHVILPKKQIVPAYFGGLTAVLVLLNFVVLLSGFIGFLALPAPSAHTVLGPPALSLYSWVIGLGLLVSFGTEMLMAVSNGRFQNSGPDHDTNG